MKDNILTLELKKLVKSKEESAGSLKELQAYRDGIADAVRVISDLFRE